MPSAATLGPDKRFFGLFVGKSGSGKTCAECSFPKPIKVLDFDGRIRGILGAPWIDRSSGIDYEYYPPRVGKPGAAQMKFTYERVNNDLEALYTLCQVGQNRYQTLILDSLTTMTYALICDSIPLSHQQGGPGGSKKGKYMGSLPMAGPEDFGFENTNSQNIMAYLRAIPIPNIIVSAHIVDRYGLPIKVENDGTAHEVDYADRVIVGEKLSIRDKLAENIPVYFDHVFRFDKDFVNNREKFKVQFRSDLARTSYGKLPNEIDVTGKSFYDAMIKAAGADADALKGSANAVEAAK